MKRIFRQESGLTGEETRESLRRFNLSASFRGMFDTVGGGTTLVFVAFAGSLGVAPEKMGWIAFIISCACMLQIAAIPLVARISDKKRLAIGLAITEPILMIGAVALALLLPHGFSIAAFMIAVFAASAFINLSRPMTDDWLAATIPTEILGRFLGRRMQIVSAVIVAAALLTGFLVENVGKTNTRGLGMILIAGALCGVLSVLVLRRASMPAMTAKSAPKLEDFAHVFRTPAFFGVTAATVLYCLPFFFACPYYQVYNLEVAAMPPQMIAFMQAGYYIVKIVSLPLLGKLADKWGPRKMMLISGMVYAWFFSIFIFCGPGWYWPIMLGWAVVALADAGYGLAVQTALYASVPKTISRPAYFAVFNIISLAFYGVGGIVAVPVLERLKDVSLAVGPFQLGNFHILYGACALMMIPCLFSAYLLKPKVEKPEVVERS